MFKHSPNRKGMVYDTNLSPMENALWLQKTWFYEGLCFEMVFLMIKNLIM